ncbi:Hypothetical predicted protein [Scomber scombrus]|uniref:Uncharacterized protein n=1 Tax=Scomber scombrus TaxID=13677 RepID=A0AAV1P0Z4_SCOSC
MKDELRLDSRNGAITTLCLENGGEDGNKNRKTAIALLPGSSFFHKHEGRKVSVDEEGGGKRAIGRCAGLFFRDEEPHIPAAPSPSCPVSRRHTREVWRFCAIKSTQHGPLFSCKFGAAFLIQLNHMKSYVCVKKQKEAKLPNVSIQMQNVETLYGQEHYTRLDFRILWTIVHKLHVWLRVCDSKNKLY